MPQNETYNSVRITLNREETAAAQNAALDIQNLAEAQETLGRRWCEMACRASAICSALATSITVTYECRKEHCPATGVHESAYFFARALKQQL